MLRKKQIAAHLLKAGSIHAFGTAYAVLSRLITFLIFTVAPD